MGLRVAVQVLVARTSVEMLRVLTLSAGSRDTIGSLKDNPRTFTYYAVNFHCIPFGKDEHGLSCRFTRIVKVCNED